MPISDDYREDVPRLAIGIIVKDEQDRLAATLKSVQPLTDLVYVLDTGSTDQTFKLAQCMDAKVSTTTFRNDFSAAVSFTR